MKQYVFIPSFWLITMVTFTSVHGQTFHSTALGAALQKMNGEIMVPLDGDYKPLVIEDNSVQEYQWALGSASEHLEIRYLTILDNNQQLLNYPHLEASRLAMQICDNSEDARITARDLTENERTNLYNADWGRVYIFPPKPTFGAYLYCKMVAVFKEGSGLMVIFHLFDEASPEIDNRLYTFRFID
ncbi:MAG: hypothetical protein HRU40_01965 [Saprospiraceae bacterium]|nr:hypothetical protein [Saprospiraceae bacterium]